MTARGEFTTWTAPMPSAGPDEALLRVRRGTWTHSPSESLTLTIILSGAISQLARRHRPLGTHECDSGVPGYLSDENTSVVLQVFFRNARYH